MGDCANGDVGDDDDVEVVMLMIVVVLVVAFGGLHCACLSSFLWSSCSPSSSCLFTSL